MTLKSITAHELKIWLDNDEAILIDVREPNEYEEERIPKSTLIPLGSACKQLLPPLNGKKLVVHCRFGKRGGSACLKLSAEDPTLEVYNLEGGITAWINAGYEIESSLK